LVLPILDVHAALAGWMHRVCADLAGCCETSVWCVVRLRLFVALPGPVGRPSPMVTPRLFGIDVLIVTIVDGARPGSRRIWTGLQNLSAELTGSRHTHSTFHPASRCRAYSCRLWWMQCLAPLMPLIETNPLRRGGPLCPPTRIGLGLPFVFANC
jgi:hypothetical protein